jgi:hypothetical protein
MYLVNGPVQHNVEGIRSQLLNCRLEPLGARRPPRGVPFPRGLEPADLVGSNVTVISADSQTCSRLAIGLLTRAGTLPAPPDPACDSGP